MNARYVIRLAGAVVMLTVLAGCRTDGTNTGGAPADSAAALQPPPGYGLEVALDVDRDGAMDFEITTQTRITHDEPASERSTLIMIRPLGENRIHFDTACGGACPLPADTLITSAFAWTTYKVAVPENGGLFAVAVKRSGAMVPGWIRLGPDGEGGVRMEAAALARGKGESIRAGRRPD